MTLELMVASTMSSSSAGLRIPLAWSRYTSRVLFRFLRQRSSSAMAYSAPLFMLPPVPYSTTRAPSAPVSSCGG